MSSDQPPPAPPAVILALHHDRNRIGFALFDAHSHTLSIGATDDADQTPTHDRSLALISMYLPTQILVSKAAPTSLVSQININLALLHSSPALNVSQNAHHWTLNFAKRNLSSLIKSGAVMFADHTHQVHSQLAVLLGDQQLVSLSVICGGALAYFVMNHQYLPPIPNQSSSASSLGNAPRSSHTDTPWGTTMVGLIDPFLTAAPVNTAPTLASQWTILCLNVVTALDSLTLGTWTMAALNLFAGSGSTHDEFTCVMHILDSTRSVDGRSQLRNWMARPSAKLADINARLDAIDILTYPPNASLLRAIRGHLVHIKSLPRILAKPLVLPTDWRALLSTLKAELTIIGCVSALVPKQTQLGSTIYPPPALKNLMMDDHVQHQEHRLVNAWANAASDVIQLIDPVIDIDTSIKENRCIVQVGIDTQLDALKLQFEQLPNVLAEINSEVCGTLPFELQLHCNTVYLPQIGYLVVLPKDILDIYTGPGRELDQFTIPGLDPQFSTPAYGYFKSHRMRELDVSLGDLYGMIMDRELEIVFVLRETIREREPLLWQMYSHIITLDVLVSLSEAANRFGYTRPLIGLPGTGLVAKRVRHPLLERTQSPFIPSDVTLGGDSYRVCLLSAPNASGKSVYLKSVALLTYLAHLGSFVPADTGAQIPLTDAILTRVSSMDSVAWGHSAFMSDLHQMGYILRQATSHSLVLIDEFGKGTSTTDGVALFAGVIEHLGNQVQCAPLTVAVTHFHELISQQLLSPSLPVGWLTTEVLHSQRGNEPELVFLYRVIPGQCTLSHASLCALSAGLHRRIVERGVLASSRIEAGECVAELVPGEEDRVPASSVTVDRFLDADLSDMDTAKAQQASVCDALLKSKRLGVYLNMVASS